MALRATGAMLLVLVMACHSTRPVLHGSDANVQEYVVDVIESGAMGSRPVPVDRGAFQEAVHRLNRDMKWKGTPREAASEALRIPPGFEEEWLAEVYREQVLTLIPLSEAGPLMPEVEATLRGDYLRWCERRGGGDCLHLLDDAPFLRTDDRRTLALALAFGSVLDETRGAVARELEPRALVAMMVWTVSMYLGLWLLPEPVTKGVAASLTLLLVAWLGVDTVWGLMDGWAQLAFQAEGAFRFAELQDAGAKFSKVLGRDAARAMILGVTALMGRTLGEGLARVKSLPGYPLAETRWEAQEGGTAVLERMATLHREGALLAAMETVDSVVAAAPGALAVVLRVRSRGGGPSGSSGHGAVTVLRHRGGNRQVLLGNGQRWHLPRGKSPQDIPVRDEVGDQLQEAVAQAAKEWGPHRLTPNERSAIDKALEREEYWLARLLEREARGRFVHARVRRSFEEFLKWNPQGVDVIDPATGYKYEILSGSESNLALHGRRMMGEFFRMLVF